MKSPYLVLTIPGIDGSGPEHWQTLWEKERNDCQRVQQRDWHDPDPDEWTGNLYRAVRAAERPVILAAHSLGCLLVDYATAHFGDWHGRVRGALLVAPADPEQPSAREAVTRFPSARTRLPFPSVAMASRNDPVATIGRARMFARRWGSRFVDAGNLGHINARSGLGAWHAGQQILDHLIGSTIDVGSTGRLVARPAASAVKAARA